MPLPEAIDFDDTSIPVIFDHCVVVYKAMYDLAEQREAEDGSSMLVYEGHLTHLLTSLNFSTPFYTGITRELKRMGCIRQLRRGGGNTPSQWLMITEPTREIYRNAPKAVYTANRSKRESQMRAIEVSMRDLYRKYEEMQKALEFILQILESHGMNQLKGQTEDAND